MVDPRSKSLKMRRPTVGIVVANVLTSFSAVMGDTFFASGGIEIKFCSVFKWNMEVVYTGNVFNFYCFI